MAKRTSSFRNMTLALLIVTVVASVSLGFVYEMTKEPIAAAKLAKKLKAIEAVAPEYDNQPVAEMYRLPLSGRKDSLEVYPLTKGGEKVGMAVRTVSGKGYSGDVWVMVGFDPEGKILQTEVLDHKETPGLGSKMSDPKFKDQFVSLHPSEDDLRVKKDGGQIDGLTGATISSRAFSEAIMTAWKIIKENEK